jgi:hypothetical protein
MRRSDQANLRRSLDIEVDRCLLLGLFPYYRSQLAFFWRFYVSGSLGKLSRIFKLRATVRQPPRFPLTIATFFPSFNNIARAATAQAGSLPWHLKTTKRRGATQD